MTSLPRSASPSPASRGTPAGPMPATASTRASRSAATRSSRSTPTPTRSWATPATAASRTSPVAWMAWSSPPIRSVSLSVAQECKELGINRVWFHKNFGAGSYSKDAHEFCRANGITALVSCPLWYGKTSDGFHRFFGSACRLLGQVPKRAVAVAASLRCPAVAGQERPSELRIFMSRMRRTPWRTAMRQALRSRGGDGHMLLPERLSGCRLRAPRGRCPRRALRVPACRTHRRGDVARSRHLRPAAGHLERRRRPHAGAARFAAHGRLRHGRPGPPGARLARRPVPMHLAARSSTSATPRPRPWHGFVTASRPEEAGAVEAKGNGSLMRILPLALVCREVDDADLASLATRASRVTHGSAEAQVACALYVAHRAPSPGRRGGPGRCAGRRTRRPARRLAVARPARLPGRGGARGGRGRTRRLRGLDRAPGRGARGGQLLVGLGGLRRGARLPRRPSSRAVRYGNDTDTTAAIAGGLAGPVLGHRRHPVRLAARSARPAHPPGAGRPTRGDRHAPSGTGRRWSTSRSDPLRVDCVDLSRHRPGCRRRRAGHDLPARQALPGLLQRPSLARPGQRRGQPAAAGHRRAASSSSRTRSCGAAGSWTSASVLPAHGVELVRFPIVDPELPSDDARLPAAHRRPRRARSAAAPRWPSPVAVAWTGRA